MGADGELCHLAERFLLLGAVCGVVGGVQGPLQPPTPTQAGLGCLSCWGSYMLSFLQALTWVTTLILIWAPKDRTGDPAALVTCSFQRQKNSFELTEDEGGAS